MTTTLEMKLSSQKPDRFFIVLLTKDGKHRGHGVVFNEDEVGDGPEALKPRAFMPAVRENQNSLGLVRRAN
jgi:hypothetical protein